MIDDILLEDTVSSLPNLDDQKGPPAEFDEHFYPLSGGFPYLG